MLAVYDAHAEEAAEPGPKTGRVLVVAQRLPLECDRYEALSGDGITEALKRNEDTEG